MSSPQATQHYNLTFVAETQLEPAHSNEQPDKENEDNCNKPKKARTAVPWVLVATYPPSANAFNDAKEALQQFGDFTQGQSYGNTVKTTEFKCARAWLSECPFKARVKVHTTTGQVSLWTAYAHDHDADNCIRGLKASVKEFLQPYVGLRCAKPKALHNLLITESGIPREDLPTLLVRVGSVIFIAVYG